jgi:cellulose biosynthesis protein BcsQ
MPQSSDTPKGNIITGFTLAKGTGLSTIVTELACALRRLDKDTKILVVDADLFKPTQHDRLAVHLPEDDTQGGLLGLLQEEVNVLQRKNYVFDCYVVKLANGVSLMKARTASCLSVPTASDQLESICCAFEDALKSDILPSPMYGLLVRSLNELLDFFRAEFDFVLIDTATGSSLLNRDLIASSDGVILPVTQNLGDLDLNLNFLCSMREEYGWCGDIYPISVGEKPTDKWEHPGINCVLKLNRWFQEHRGQTCDPKLLRHTIRHVPDYASNTGLIATELTVQGYSHPKWTYFAIAEIIAQSLAA